MPGLVGVVSARGADEAAGRFAAARDRMLRHDGTTASSFQSPHGDALLGHVRLSTGDAGDSKQGHVAFHGVLYNQQELARDAGVPPGSIGPAELVAALYQKHGASCIPALEGEFCLAIVDAASGKVILATDTTASYPIYWRVDDAGLVFASDLSAVIRTLPRAPRLDLRAVADYLTLGAIVGDRTLAEGVSLLGPGSILTYASNDRRVTIEPYVRLETFFRNKTTDKAGYLESVATAFSHAVRRATGSGTSIGLSLSGGLDSRALLSAVPAGVSLRTYTLGVEGCADQVIAQKLSSIAGTTHSFFRLDRSYLHDFLPNMAQMVSLTDGMYLSHGLTEMLAIRFLGETGIRVLLRGHGGELAKAHLAWPLHTDERVYQMTTLEELVPYLSRRANYVTGGLALSSFLTPSASAQAGEGTVESFAAALRGTDVSPADACSYLYLRELHRRFTIPSLELFRTRVEVRLPYVDPEFLRVLLAAPPPWRDSTAIHTLLTGRGRPGLLEVRNSNTGARANAGPREEFVFDKINTILKRLNVYGYRHYHDFDSWMRRMLLETVQTELLGPDARVLTFVSKPALESLIRETREGAGRAYLLQVLLILELWQRENGVSAV